MMVPFPAVVIGAGMIGAAMDVGRAGQTPRTHAGAYVAHPDFDLRGIYALNMSSELSCFGAKLFDDLDAMLKAASPVIVSVAVPAAHQPEILKKLVDVPGLRVVIAEKPLTPTLAQTREVIDLYERAGKTLIVNITRRYQKTYRDLAQRFDRGEEKVLSASITYAKGFLHNGIHAVDLARFLFGECEEGVYLAARADANPADPSAAVFLSFTRAPQVFLKPLDDRYYTHFEVDVFTDRARYVINNDHRTLTHWSRREGVGIPLGLRLIAQAPEATDYDHAMTALMDNAAGVLRGTEAPICTGREAYAAQDIIERLARDKKFTRGGAR
jgi:predicted dehydrogenase